MSIHKFGVLAGVLASLVGLVFILTPISETASNGYSMDCGSIVSPNQVAGLGADIYDLYTGGRGRTGGKASCEDARDGQKAWVFPLLFGGLVVSLGAWLTSPRKEGKDKPASPTPGEASPA